MYGTRHQLVQVRIAGCRIHTRFGGNVLSNTPCARQELLRTGGRNIRPVHIIFGRRSEDHGGAHRIHTELIKLLTQVYAIAERLRHGLTAVENLPLIHESFERLAVLNQPQITNNFREETRIQQVQNRMFHATHVHIDRAPFPDRLRVERTISVAGRNIAQEVPGRIHEGIHRVGIAAGALTALWAGNYSPVIGGSKGRLSLGRQLFTAQIIWQQNRQLFFRNQYFAAVFTVNHGNRRAPETLAREQPVAQAVNNLTFAGASSLNQLGSLRNSFCLRKSG